MELTAAGREALTRGLALAMQGPQRQQLQAKLRDVERGEDTWERVAAFACYSMQVDILALKPWEAPPCHAGKVIGRGREYCEQPKAMALLKRLLDAGLSRNEPDPFGALAKIEAVPPAA